MAKYIEASTFEDFKKNQEVMIQTFNHNITTISQDAQHTKEKVTEIGECVAEIRGSLKVTGKIVWWILGIIAVILGAAVLSSIRI